MDEDGTESLLRFSGEKEYCEDEFEPLGMTGVFGG